MKVTCQICAVPCVGCKGRCNCGMREHQAKTMNEILLEVGNSMDIEKRDKVVSMVRKNHGKAQIMNFIETGGDIVESKNPGVSKYCQYPIGSGSRGARIGCIKCGVARFHGLGKVCAKSK